MVRGVDELIHRLQQIKVEEAEVIEELVLSRSLEGRSITDTANESTYTDAQQQLPDNTIRVGSRVQITNKVRAPFGRQQTTADDRNATVYRINGDKVYFVTDRGLKTWRVKQNLRKID